MKNKNTLVLGGAFLLLIILYFVTSFHPREVTEGSTPLFKGKAPDIDKVEISSPREGDVTLERQGDAWYITKPLSYKASAEAVRDLLVSLGGMMVDGVVSSKIEERVRFGVADSGSIHLEAFGGGKTVLDVFIGRYTPDISHTYVRMNGSDDIMLWRGINARFAVRDLDGWRDRTIYSFNEGDITSVTVTGSGVSRRLVLSDSTWSYTENGAERSVDQTRTWASVQRVAALSGDTFASGDDIPRAGSTPADFQVSFTVRNGDTHMFELWIPKSERDGGRYLIRPEKGEQLFTLSGPSAAILTFDYANLAVRR